MLYFFLELLEFSEDRNPWESVEEKLNAIRWESFVHHVSLSRPPSICASNRPPIYFRRDMMRTMVKQMRPGRKWTASGYSGNNETLSVLFQPVFPLNLQKSRAFSSQWLGYEIKWCVNKSNHNSSNENNRGNTKQTVSSGVTQTRTNRNYSTIKYRAFL